MEKCTGKLGIEVVHEPVHRHAQVRSHSLSLSIAHLSQPPVLECGQNAEKNEKSHSDLEREGLATIWTPHGRHCNTSSTKLLRHMNWILHA
jgi:hypothetical protein